MSNPPTLYVLRNTIPVNSRVEVTNINKKIIVVISDHSHRPANRSDQRLYLFERAAIELGINKKGLIRCKSNTYLLT